MDEDHQLYQGNFEGARQLRSHRTGVAIFDLDDTLVDRESTFINAQLSLLEVLQSHGLDIEPKAELARLRVIDSRLIKYHGTHNYDFAELAAALWMIYEGMSEDQAIRLCVKPLRGQLAAIAAEARARHNDALHKIPPLKEGAREVLQYLKDRYVLVLLSEGDEKIQMGVIEHYGLQSIFDAVLIRNSKTVKDFEIAKEVGLQILTREYDGTAEKIVVVGDRISQDIEPGNKISATTVWIPGPYLPGQPRLPYQRPTFTFPKLPDIVEVL